MSSPFLRPASLPGAPRALLLLAAAAASVGGCGSDLGPDPTVVHTLEPVRTVVRAYHPLRLRLPPGATMPPGPVAAVTGADTLWLGPSGDTLLVGILLDLGDGDRTLTVPLGADEMGEATFTAVAAPAVANPQRALDSLSVLIDEVVSTLSADTSAMGHGGAAEVLAAEFEGLVASMTSEEKRELVALLASYPEDLAALGMSSFGGLRLGTPGEAADVLAASGGSTADVEQAVRAGVTGFFDVLDQIALEADALAKSTGVGSWWDRAVAQAGTYLGAIAELAKFEKIRQQWSQVEFFPFKPGPGYNDLWYDLTGETANSSVVALASNATNPITFQNGVPVSFSVFHRYETLRLADRGEAEGDTQDLLDLITRVETWWTDTRLLLEQVARDLGYDRSFAILDLPYPRLEAIYSVPGSEFTLGDPSDTDVTCAAGGEATLVLECSTTQTTEQEFTILATYSTDFGLHELEIEGVATGCWDPSALPGEWIRRTYTDETRTELYSEVTVTFTRASGPLGNPLNNGSWDISYYDWGSWSYDCASNRLAIMYGTFDNPSLWFRPNPAIPDTIPRDGEGTSVWGDRPMDLIRK